MNQTAPVTGEEKAQALLERLWNIEREDDLGALLALGVVEERRD